jgi:hypothetical protein
MQSTDDIIKILLNLVNNNGIVISLVLLLIAVIYINFKVNDLNYRLQQTLMYPDKKKLS